MKSLYTFISLLFFTTLYSQTSPDYTWVNGTNLFNQPGVFGTKGVAASSNAPGGRENAVSWVDKNNNLWLFGGQGYATGTTEGYLNDLWKYTISSNQWTWVSGNNTTNHHGIYGTKGTPSANNYPGGRQNAITWTDSTGNLWMFGGMGYAAASFANYLNDLWKYDIANNQWTWISGADSTLQTATYGTLGVPASSNVPSARFGGSGWTDNNNNLWMFGGQGYATGQLRYNDLWKFNITTGMWTWISGTNSADQNGIYGTMGTAASSNAPGARQASAAWKDINGNFWMFGGYGFPASGAHSYLNDLWKYDSNTNLWTWVSGTNQTNQLPNYGTVGVAAASNIPGARQMSIAWTDVTNNLWMFGGWGYAQSGFGRLSDLWEYNAAANEWTWAKAPSLPNYAGTYGTEGVSATTNVPGARRMSISWLDNTGKCWLFGGNGYDANDSLGLLNDLWYFETSATTGIQTIQENKETFTIYPNPVTATEMVVEFTCHQTQEVELTDLFGKVLTIKTVENKGKLDLSKLSPGIYLIKTNSSVKRFIKQ